MLQRLFQSTSPTSGNAYIQIESEQCKLQLANPCAQDAAGANSANGLAFREVTAPAGPAARVYFQQGGNVGIGITNNGAFDFAVAVRFHQRQTWYSCKGTSDYSSGQAPPPSPSGMVTTSDSVLIGDAGGTSSGKSTKVLRFQPLKAAQPDGERLRLGLGLDAAR